MTKKIILILLALALLFASAFLCVDAFAATTFCPWDVVATITYKGDSYVYRLSQQICDDMDAASRGFYLGVKGKKSLFDHLNSTSLPTKAVCSYILPNFDKLLLYFDYVCKSKIDAMVNFDKKGFSYTKGQDGIEIDVAQLFLQMIQSGGKHITITLPTITHNAVTVNQLKQNTVLKGKFTTQFAASSPNRCYNIGKATESLNGITVQPNQKFSFNQIVGERTIENGYKTSKVILDGNYTDGVGGGVCQVSTTLYNALLLANILPSACQHSLVPSYVMAGFDAMVSYGSADLTFTNTTSHPLYVSASVQDKSVTFAIYGEPNQYTIQRKNDQNITPFDTIFVTDAVKYPSLLYSDEQFVVQNGSNGVASVSYLEYYQEGKLVFTKKIRQNTYKKVDKIIATGTLERQ